MQPVSVPAQHHINPARPQHLQHLEVLRARLLLRLHAETFVPWFLIALLAVVWLRYGPTHRRRY